MKRKYLRACRESLGLPRPAVANKLGISQIHLRKLEDGSVNPSVLVLQRFCELYGKNPQELFPDIFRYTTSRQR
ncbi:helix-turn-helix transcriptional regulator [Paenibacillus larvae]